MIGAGAQGLNTGESILRLSGSYVLLFQLPNHLAFLLFISTPLFSFIYSFIQVSTSLSRSINRLRVSLPFYVFYVSYLYLPLLQYFLSTSANSDPFPRNLQGCRSHRSHSIPVVYLQNYSRCCRSVDAIDCYSIPIVYLQNLKNLQHFCSNVVGICTNIVEVIFCNIIT